MALDVIQPSRMTVMIKPVGAMCNLECSYCYYLPTKALYDGKQHRMSDTVLEDLFACLLGRFDNQVTIAWQGGEPTLAGLDFFRRAMELQEKYKRPGQQISNALQTNATLLDDDWGRFLNQHRFLVGVSIDGPGQHHDHYRLDIHGQGSSDKVMGGLRYLQKHHVEYNILCVLHDANVLQPEQVLGFLLNLGARHLQFIPAIEWEDDPASLDPSAPRPLGPSPPGPSAFKLAPFSPKPHDYGRFLCRVFDQWFERYRRRLSVRLFDTVLNKLVHGFTPLCILDSACHNQLTVEHDGAVFGCDHYVQRRWQLGMIDDRSWFDRIDTERLNTFAAQKQHLPDTCMACKWKPYCHGGCPKHRSQRGQTAEATVLCAAYKMFFEHAMGRMQWLASYLKENRMPPDPSASSSPRPPAPPAPPAPPGRNQLCPCGSGVKYKKCCGRVKVACP